MGKFPERIRFVSGDEDRPDTLVRNPQGEPADWECDYVRAICAALSGQPTAEVERLKRRVAELEGLLRECVSALTGRRRDALRDKVRHALSPDTPERGEGGEG